MTVIPNAIGGLLVVILTVLGSIAAIWLLFGWDDPDRSRTEKDQDILGGRHDGD